MMGAPWARSELSDVTVRRYLDLLSSLFLVRQLPPWHENLGKRLVKSPPVGNSPSEMATHLETEIDRWAKIAREAKIPPKSF